ncbi:MAG: diacylglycerol kinase family protein, partial [Gammaproteobacteria bacterium]
MPADSRSNADAALAGATVVIRNPAAGGGAAAPSSLVDALGRRGGHVVERITTVVGSAAQFAAEAATAGAGLVVVHGGDGTVHEVVNGLVELPR